MEKRDFKHGVIKVRETRVRGEEGRPKTPGSTRDIRILPPVADALRDQEKVTMDKTEYAETLKMILERYYSYIRNYQRDDGSAFMANVYDPSVVETEAEVWDKTK
jgi:hypothetical protein